MRNNKLNKSNKNSLTSDLLNLLRVARSIDVRFVTVKGLRWCWPGARWLVNYVNVFSNFGEAVTL